MVVWGKDGMAKDANPQLTTASLTHTDNEPLHYRQSVVNQRQYVHDYTGEVAITNGNSIDLHNWSQSEETHSNDKLNTPLSLLYRTVCPHKQTVRYTLTFH